MKKTLQSNVALCACCGFAILAIMMTAGCFNGSDKSKKRTMVGLVAALIANSSGSTSSSSSSTSSSSTSSTSSSTSGGTSSGGTGDTIADYRVAKESVLRSIPQTAIDAAKNNLRIYFFHTSHGSRVVTGMTGLLSYKSGDGTNFAFTSGGAPVSGRLWFQEENYDLGNPENTWDTRVRNYLNSHTGINVVMGSWCDPAGHNHQSYIDRMESLIRDYPAITFVFMTGHPNGDGENLNGNTAYHCHTLVTEHCRENNRFCIDYWSIETHGMDDAYYPNANDDGLAGSDSFYYEWMNSHSTGTDYYNCSCAHTTNQRITCNRIAYAAWWMWARVAGWSGE